MYRIVAALAAGALSLIVLILISPFLLIGSVLMFLLAWRKPTAIARITNNPKLSPVPSGLRSTPMRFAASLVVVTLALTAVDVAIAGPRDPDDEATSALASATPRPTAVATEQPSSLATERPTAAQRATPRPTPTPEPTPAFGQEPTGPIETGRVVNVVDGDTIDVLVNGVAVRVRYIGMDTPEVHNGNQWLGAEASAANAALVDGKEVILEKDVSETDQYGRALRYVWVRDGAGWLLVNLELIRQGFAQVSTYPPDVKYVDALYLAAQEEARSSALGIWGAPPTPVPTPVPLVAPPPASNCHASYSNVCLTPGIGDYDCAGGSGNGPYYVVGPVYVVGYDEFGLDRDGDGIGCE